MTSYVHGYNPQESVRLDDQAQTLVELLHGDTGFAAGSAVLEVGCGVGAQTVTLAQQSPGAQITAIDISAASVARARARLERDGLTNVTFVHADVFAAPFAPGSFDHVFICFVLEHLAEPAAALAALRGLLKPGGTITVIEGDHGSTFFYPDSDAATAAIDCQVQLQAASGGDAKIGRRLYPLLDAAGFACVHVSPRNVYVDASRPSLVDGFTRKTFTAMIEGVRGRALTARLIDADRFDAGIRDLHRTTEPDGIFSYTFFKATATVSAPLPA
jgi:SAM-dependent methyltransferase